MNATIQELTAALQELTARETKELGSKQPQLPKTLTSGELTLSPEVESFLDARREYTAKTRDVSVGMY
jgi:hypothetical protein